MTQQHEFKLIIYSLFITAGMLMIGYWWLTDPYARALTGFPSPFNQNQTPPVSAISLGGTILVTADTNSDKEAGVEAFVRGDFTTAVAKFQSSLQQHPNDPEALIYLNNARVAALPHLKIAVSVPIGANLNVALEILRGVAQAQEEVNRYGGINGNLLQVEIANDNNDPNAARELAGEFVSDSTVLAVVGHNSSDVSIAAASIYQHGGLVTISPTSTAKELTGIGSYIFRTVPSSSVEAKTLADYAIKTARLTNITICADSQDKASKSVTKEFTSYVEADRGKITRTNCDFSNPNFSPDRAVSQANSAGADGLLLVPSVNKLGQAVEIARSNKSRLLILSYSVMYTFKTLQLGQGNVNGMVLTVPWHPKAFPGNPFPNNAAKLWGGQVSWRTAESYDATQAIISGLKQSNTRNGLQEALSNRLRAYGATGTIKFLPDGDRAGAVMLVRVDPGNKSDTGYDFVPLSE